MFPENNINLEEITENSVISDNTKIRKTPNFNFKKNATVLKNGDAELIEDYANVRNWIIRFLTTPLGVHQIYDGTGFGTSLYRLRGYKSIGGLEYAQIKKEIEDGFKLNPNIQRVLDVQLYKKDKKLCVYVKCQLLDGYILEEKTETFEIK